MAKRQQLPEEVSSPSENEEDVLDSSHKANSSLSDLGLSPLKFQKVTKWDLKGYAKCKISQAQLSMSSHIAAADG